MPEEQSTTATDVAERLAVQAEKTSVKDVPEEVAEDVAEVLEGESETSEAEEESSAPLKTDEDEVGELIKAKPEAKDNVQKRIDQLTAKLKQQEAELAQYKQKAPEVKGEPEYTDAQLRKALADAMDKGDSDLVFEVMEYKAKKVERDLRKAYQEEISSKQVVAQKIAEEWHDVVTDYSKVWEDDSGKEIYPGASKDLDVTNGDSLLYRTAKALYERTPENGRNPYLQPGGQRTVVADALALILRKKKLSGNEKKLERALSKEKRKKALGSGSAMESESPAKLRTSKENLSDYMEERSKFLRERK